MVTLRMADYRRGYVRLHLLDGGRWRWVNVAVQAPHHAMGMFEQSERERERVAALRAEQKVRMAAQGRTDRTAEEREALRPAPGIWVAQSPTLIRREGDWWLHVPFAKRVEIAGRAEEQRQADPTLRVGTVDLNADSAVAAAWEGRCCRGVNTVWHARENAKRERVLQKVARKQRRSGRAVKGERSNRARWRYVHDLDASVEAKRAAETSRCRKAVAAASRKGSPETGGANARLADAPAA